MSAQTRQTDLDGNKVWERPPTQPQALVIYETGRLVDGTPAWYDTALFALAADAYGKERALAWVRRAAAEGVIATSGGER